MIPSPVESYSKHEIIISAEILNAENIGKLSDSNIPSQMGNMDVYDRYDVRIIETFKGQFSKNKQVLMSNYWGDGFKKKQKVLMYLKNHEKYYVIPLCSGSRELKSSKEAISKLRKLSLENKKP